MVSGMGRRKIYLGKHTATNPRKVILQLKGMNKTKKKCNSELTLVVLGQLRQH